MLARQLGHAVVDLAPHLVARHRAQFVARNLHRQFHRAPVADVDDVRVRAQELRHFFDRAHRRRQADLLQRAARQRLQPRHRQRQMRAALVVRHGVNLIHDQRPHGRAASRAASPPSAGCTAIPGVVTRMCGACLPICCALGRGRVAGAHRRANRRKRDALARAPAPRSQPAASPGSCERRCSAP